MDNFKDIQDNILAGTENFKKVFQAINNKIEENRDKLTPEQLKTFNEKSAEIAKSFKDINTGFTDIKL